MKAVTKNNWALAVHLVPLKYVEQRLTRNPVAFIQTCCWCCPQCHPHVPNVIPVLPPISSHVVLDVIYNVIPMSSPLFSLCHFHVVNVPSPWCPHVIPKPQNLLQKSCELPFQPIGMLEIPKYHTYHEISWDFTQTFPHLKTTSLLKMYKIAFLAITSLIMVKFTIFLGGLSLHLNHLIA